MAGESAAAARRQAAAARETEIALRATLVKALDVLEIDTGLETGAACTSAAELRATGKDEKSGPSDAHL